MCAECDYAPECYACIVGVATGPESHSPCCPARGIPMPEQDGSFGPEWDEWERAVEQAKHSPPEQPNPQTRRRNDRPTPPGQP